MSSNLSRLTPLASTTAELVLKLLACAPQGLNALTRLTGATGDRAKIAALTSAIDAPKRAGTVRLKESRYELVDHAEVAAGQE
jgi:hypothetical protein